MTPSTNPGFTVDVATTHFLRRRLRVNIFLASRNFSGLFEMAAKFPEEDLSPQKLATGEEDLRMLLDWETPDVAASFRAHVSN